MGGILTAFQRRRAAELMEGLGNVEISEALEHFDPEGRPGNLSLVSADSKFRRLFAAALRRKHSEWE